jgi:hypothetical protein
LENLAQGLGCRVQDKGLEFTAQGLGLRVQVTGLGVSGYRFLVTDNFVYVLKCMKSAFEFRFLFTYELGRN